MSLEKNEIEQFNYCGRLVDSSLQLYQKQKFTLSISPLQKRNNSYRIFGSGDHNRSYLTTQQSIIAKLSAVRMKLTTTLKPILISCASLVYCWNSGVGKHSRGACARTNGKDTFSKTNPRSQQTGPMVAVIVHSTTRVIRRSKASALQSGPDFV